MVGPAQLAGRSVGTYVPVVTAPVAGSDEPASAKVMSALDAAPPVSDMSTTFWPAGPTSSALTSAEFVCVKPFSVTVMPLIVPVTLETAIGEA